MSRPLEYGLPKSYETPAPAQYMLKVTSQGQSLLANISRPCIQQQIRGTMGKDDRFRDYKYNAFVRSTPMVGPGSHKDQENFKSLKRKPCKAVMVPQYFERKDSLRSFSKSSTSSRRSSGKKRLFSGSNQGYNATGYLIQKSPSHCNKDQRLNYNMYKQDSFEHREHLLDVIKRKDLKKRVVSYKPEGSNGFKVGYTGNIKELYRKSEKYIKEVSEEKRKKANKKRVQMYKEMVKRIQSVEPKANLKKRINYTTVERKSTSRSRDISSSRSRSLKKINKYHPVLQNNQNSLVHIGNIRPSSAKSNGLSSNSVLINHLSQKGGKTRPASGIHETNKYSETLISNSQFVIQEEEENNYQPQTKQKRLQSAKVRNENFNLYHTQGLQMAKYRPVSGKGKAYQPSVLTYATGVSTDLNNGNSRQIETIEFVQKRNSLMTGSGDEGPRTKQPSPLKRKPKGVTINQKMEQIERKAQVRHQRMTARNQFSSTSGPIKAMMFSPNTYAKYQTHILKSPEQATSIRTLQHETQVRKKSHSTKLSMAQIYDPYDHPVPKRKKLKRKRVPVYEYEPHQQLLSTAKKPLNIILQKDSEELLEMPSDLQDFIKNEEKEIAYSHETQMITYGYGQNSKESEPSIMGKNGGQEETSQFDSIPDDKKSQFKSIQEEEKSLEKESVEKQSQFVSLLEDQKTIVEPQTEDKNSIEQTEEKNISLPDDQPQTEEKNVTPPEEPQTIPEPLFEEKKSISQEELQKQITPDSLMRESDQTVLPPPQISLVPKDNTQRNSLDMQAHSNSLMIRSSLENDAQSGSATHVKNLSKGMTQDFAMVSIIQKEKMATQRYEVDESQSSNKTKQISEEKGVEHEAAKVRINLNSSPVRKIKTSKNFKEDAPSSIETETIKQRMPDKKFLENHYQEQQSFSHFSEKESQQSQQAP